MFEGGRVSLGAQNRPQEAPRGDKKQHRNKKKEKIRFIDPVDVLEAPGGTTSTPGGGLSRGCSGVGPVRAGAPESPMNQRSPDIWI